MGKQVPTTAIYRRLGLPSGLPKVHPTRPSYLQRLLSLFSPRSS